MTSSPVESLLDQATVVKMWPRSIINNPTFLHLVTLRQKVSQIIDVVSINLSNPTMRLNVALKEGCVTRIQVLELYMALTTLLADRDYERVLLYIPFEYLPALDWFAGDTELEHAVHELRTTYTATWRRLLCFHDVRANFVDGDIQENDQLTGDFPRVVKAAHLTPWLLQAELLSVNDVTRLIETSSDKLLTESLIEGLLAAIELGIVEQNEFTRTLLVPTRPQRIVEPPSPNRVKWLAQKKAREVMEIVTSSGRSIAGPFSANVLANNEYTDSLNEIVSIIEKSAELLHYLYPVVITFGSTTKGYSDSLSDTDLAVLVRPNISFDERKTMHELMKSFFPPQTQPGEIMEFWLSEESEMIKIVSNNSGAVIGEDYWSHVLFGGVWIGDETVICHLYEKLLSPYFFTNRSRFNIPLRQLCIGELERDALQYRLMHSGYEKCFNSLSQVEIENPGLIDAGSMFWDSGYRQVALRLFASRVFLPKL